MDEVQLHQTNGCPAIESDDYQIPKPVDVTMRWYNKDTTGPQTGIVYIILSDVSDEVPLKCCANTNIFQSGTIQLHPGLYTCQLINGDEIHPMKQIQITVSTDIVDIQLNSDVDCSTQLLPSTSNLQLPSQTVAELQPDPRTQLSLQNENLHVNNYTLNRNTSLLKKRKACDNKLYAIKHASNNIVMQLSTASFELFKAAFLKYLSEKQTNNQYLFKMTPQVDG